MCSHSRSMVVIITTHVWSSLKSRDDKLIQPVTRRMEDNNITSLLLLMASVWINIITKPNCERSRCVVSFPHWSPNCQLCHLRCNYHVIAEASACTSWAPITGIQPGMDYKCNWLCWHNCYKVITCYFLQRGLVTQAAGGRFQAVQLQSV